MKRLQFTSLLITISFLSSSMCLAQNKVEISSDSLPKSSFFLMVRQPLTWITKPSFYLGFKTPKHSLILGSTFYTANIFVRGSQVSLEYQRNINNVAKNQMFVYGRLAYGHVLNSSRVFKHDYLGIAAGVGYNLFMDKKKKLFFQPAFGLNWGNLNFNYVPYHTYFYLGGPGTPIDLKLRFGFIL